MSTEVKNILDNLSKNEDGSYTLTQSSVDNLSREATQGQERTDKFREEAKEFRQKNSGLSKEVSNITYLKDDLEASTKEVEEYKTKLTEKDTLLTGFYDQKRSDLKDLAKTVDFENDTFKSRENMFSYITDIDKMDNDQIFTSFTQLQRDLNMIGVKKEPDLKLPNAKDSGGKTKTKATGLFSYKNN